MFAGMDVRSLKKDTQLACRITGNHLALGLLVMQAGRVEISNDGPAR